MPKERINNMKKNIKSMFSMFLALCICISTPMATFAKQYEGNAVESLVEDTQKTTTVANSMYCDQGWVFTKDASGTFTVPSPGKCTIMITTRGINTDAELNLVVYTKLTQHYYIDAKVNANGTTTWKATLMQGDYIFYLNTKGDSNAQYAFNLLVYPS